MVATVNINPNLTSVAAGTFNVTSTGYIQGTALNDPAIRNELAGGILATIETLPMWGGVAISEALASASLSTTLPANNLGNTITRATNYTSAATAGAISGFSVFDQDHSMINSPQSPVPLAPSGGLVNYYRLGSGARIAVACDSNLATDLVNGIIAQQVSWDYTNQQLVPFLSATVSSGTYGGATTVSAGTYNTTTGTVSLTTNSTHGIQVGSTFTLSAFAGTGSFAALNGTQVATTGTTGSTLNFTAQAGLTLTISSANLGTVGVSLTTSAPHGLLPGDTFIPALTGTGSFANLNVIQTAGPGTTGSTIDFNTVSGLTLAITGGTVSNGAAIPVKVLNIEVGNSMTVSYASSTGYATWNRSGSTAIILI